MPEFYRQPDVSKLELVNLLVETLKPVGKISVHWSNLKKIIKKGHNFSTSLFSFEKELPMFGGWECFITTSSEVEYIIKKLILLAVAAGIALE